MCKKNQYETGNLEIEKTEKGRQRENVFLSVLTGEGARGQLREEVSQRPHKSSL